MTREEAKHIVDVAFDVPQAVRRAGEDRTYHEDEIREAKDMAINALEELPKRRKEAKRWKTKAMQNNSCDDAISRQAAIDAILTKYTEYERLKMLHFTPNIIKQECADLLTDLPSIQPIRPPGHWIKTQAKQGGISETWYNCSECGWRNALYLPRSFCPNCGCRMVDSQESDHKCHTCKHYTSGEHDGSCGSYICKGFSDWESEEQEKCSM